MKQQIRLIYLCMILSVSLQAQETEEDISSNLSTFGHTPSLTLKFAPLTMAEPIYNTFEFGVEYKFHPKYSIQGQLGYGNHLTSFYYDPDFNNERYRNFRVRLEGRYYFTSARSMSPSMRRALFRNPALENSERFKAYVAEKKARKHGYLAIDLGWKNTLFFEEGFLGQECEDGQCAFQRFVSYNRIKNVGLLHFKLGEQRFYGPKFCLDYYIGIGGRFINVALSEEGLDTGEDFFFSLIDVRTPGSFVTFSISAGIKLGYSLALKERKKI